MTPTPPDSGSPLATLRQLKEMLDAGTLTPQEFEALKQRLIFGSLASGLPDVGTVPGREASPHIEPVVVPFTPPAPAETSHPSAYLDTPGALTPEATPLLAPEPDWLAAPAPPLLPTEAEEETADAPAERRNPLNLLFAIGGLLLFLAVVGYLAFDRRPAGPDEHLTSTSQTAADSAAAAPEVGPQAQQLTLPPATAPETVRVAPAVVPVPAAPAPLAADSAAPAASAPAAVPAVIPKPAVSKPAAKEVAPKPAATPAADSAASRP